jgi:hypothetical protein
MSPLVFAQSAHTSSKEAMAGNVRRYHLAANP